jgi:transposase
MIMTRKHYSKEFKDEAVGLILRDGRSAKEVALELGLHPSMVARWKREYLEQMNQDAPSLKGRLKPSEIEAENQKLRRELQKVREQRDILKKAVGIFSQPPNRPTGS